MRTNVYDLLVNGLGILSAQIRFEKLVRGEVRGFLDALLGRTVFKFKSNLRSEIHEAVASLPSSVPLSIIGQAADLVHLANDLWMPARRVSNCRRSTTAAWTSTMGHSGSLETI